jgi:N-acetylglucosaminyl-diphospho-decaprenol L-rhamnosyltransferase
LEGILLAAAAVIVTHNSAGVIDACLEALFKMAPGTQAIVIDNASLDETVIRVKSKAVTVIANRENRGFAAAVNQGFRATDAEFVVVLNPDVSLLAPIDELMDACREHGIAAGKLVDAKGRAQAGFTIRRLPTPLALSLELLGFNGIFPWNRANRSYRYLDRSLEERGVVEQPAGAFLMIRRDVWEKLGGFDEGFHPVWFEDVDFCRRAIDAGFRIEFLPEVPAAHLGAHSVGQMETGCREWYWCVSLLRYAAKHYSGFGYRGVCVAMLLSSAPRMLAGLIRERSLSPVVVQSRIAKFAGSRLVCLSRRWITAVPAS